MITKREIFFCIPSVVYLFFAVISLPLIGLGWDTSVNLAKGEQVFNFLKSLNVSFLIDGFSKSLYFKEIPALQNGHPPAFSFIAFLFGNFLSKIFGFKYYFFHVANVLTASVFIFVVTKYLFYKATKNPLLSVLGSLVLISIPYYFVYSIVNTKDFPVLAFTTFSAILLTRDFNNRKLQFVLSLIFFLLAIFTKFTSIFLLPFLIFLLIKNTKLKQPLLKSKKIYVILLLVTVYSCLFFFWPHFLFNFIYEIQRLYYVYFLLPSKSINYVNFLYYYNTQTPIIFIVIYVFSLIYVIKTSKYRNFYLFWVGPAVFYLLLVNRQYDVIRQFLFLSLPFVYPICVYLNSLYKSKKLVYFIISSVLLFYSFYLLFLPPYKKIVYSNVLLNQELNDGWGLTLPSVIDYIYKNHPKGRVYFSPAAFLLEYYNLDKNRYEIIYDPYYADIFITTVQTSSYLEEKQLRENFFVKDTNFSLIGKNLEIWIKK